MERVEMIEFLTKQREEYREALKMLFQRLEKEGREPFVEHIDEFEHEGKNDKMLFNFFRYDILVKSDDDYYEVKVNINPIICENPREFKENSLEVLVNSFVWNACAINFSTLILDTKPIRDWYLKWIRPDKDNMEKELMGVIHSLVIVSGKNESEVIIDFGSAPITAMIEFFSVLAAAGIKKLTLKSAYS